MALYTFELEMLMTSSYDVSCNLLLVLEIGILGSKFASFFDVLVDFFDWLKRIWKIAMLKEDHKMLLEPKIEMW